MSNKEIHPFVEKMKDIIKEALEPKLTDLYSADEMDNIENNQNIDSFINQYMALISLTEKATQDSYILFVRDSIDLQNKLKEIQKGNKYNIIGIDNIRR